MIESEYWEQLRFLLNHVAGLPNGWCDWFAPKQYVLDGQSPRINGRVGFVNGRNAATWEFTLYLDHAVDSLEQVKWSALLPVEGSTTWLRCDEFHHRLEIDPSQK